MNLCGAIFDLDGTLLDSMTVWNTLGESYLKRRGILPKEGLGDRLKTMSLAQAASLFQSEYGLQEDVDQIIAGINGQIAEFYQNEVLPKRGVPAFLEKLRKKNVRMCIATATDRGLAEAALRRNGLLDYFVDILTCSAVGSGKDTPAVFDAALRALGTAKEETVVFEDALHAIETAKGAGYWVAAMQDDAAEPYRERIVGLADGYYPSFCDIRLDDASSFRDISLDNLHSSCEIRLNLHK